MNLRFANAKIGATVESVHGSHAVGLVKQRFIAEVTKLELRDQENVKQLIDNS